MLILSNELSPFPLSFSLFVFLIVLFYEGSGMLGELLAF